MKYFVFLFLAATLLLSEDVWGQRADSGNKQPAITLNHIAIYVHELKESTDFYKEVLGLQEIPEPFKDGKHTWFTIGGGSQLHLIQGAESVTSHDKNSHLCFSVPSVDTFIRNLEKHNVAYENWPGDAKAPTVRVDGIKQVYFQDPDGYWVEVNDDFPER